MFYADCQYYYYNEYKKMYNMFKKRKNTGQQTNLFKKKMPNNPQNVPPISDEAPLNIDLTSDSSIKICKHV